MFGVTRSLRDFQSWRQETLTQLLGLFPDEEPWQLDSALSFLQPEPVDLNRPLRLDLFFHERPLAIDLLGDQHLPDWRAARSYYRDRQSWEQARAQLAHKSLVLGQYRCPYLTLWRHESSHPDALRERLIPLLGKLPD